MLNKLLFTSAALALSMSNIAMAQHLTPPDTDFTATGDITFAYDPFNLSTVCTLQLTGETNEAVDSPATKTDGAVVYGGVNIAGAGCGALTVGPGSITHVSGSVWQLSPVVVTHTMAGVICNGTIEFEVDGGFILIEDQEFSAGCHAEGIMETDPSINNVP